jgi:pimeloyl-ACP methyl ester carboxylesterase
MSKQNEMVLLSAGISKDAVDAYLPLYEGLMKTVIALNDTNAAINASKKMVQDWFNQTDKAFVKATTNISNETDINNFATSMAQALSTQWWKYFAAYDPQPTLRKLNCPVLAINGTADIQVPASVNLKGIETALKKGGNKKFVTKEFTGLNHLFQYCSKCTVAEYGQLETTIEPPVLDFIGNWLQSLN